MGAEASPADARSEPQTDASPPQVEASPAEAQAEREALGARGIVRVRASNPGPMTLSGTNTWVVGRDPAWVIDPGPLLDEHLERLLAVLDARGGLGGVVLTHDHSDHSEAVRALLDARPAPLAAGRGEVDIRLEDGERVGPFQALAAPGHAPDRATALAGSRYQDLSIRGQRTRWGSCSAGGHMSFNWRLLLAPECVLEYVVWHEVCHLQILDHSPRFWALVERHWPSYREERAWLSRNGATLVL